MSSLEETLIDLIDLHKKKPVSSWKNHSKRRTRNVKPPTHRLRVLKWKRVKYTLCRVWTICSKLQAVRHSDRANLSQRGSLSDVLMTIRLPWAACKEIWRAFLSSKGMSKTSCLPNDSKTLQKRSACLWASVNPLLGTPGHLLWIFDE